jgi:hypothetical protein
MKERGRYQIQLMKTRSSSGVGQKVDLEFNLESLRITDPGEESSRFRHVAILLHIVLYNLPILIYPTTVKHGKLPI